MSEKETLISWLNDAHGMEKHLVQVLESQAAHAQDFPEIQSRIQQHADQTKQHAELVSSCIENLGGSPSTLKSGMSTIMGAVQGAGSGVAEDALIKDALSSFAAENFEIASYKALIEAASSMGEQQVVTVCRQILRDEEEMATWLSSNLPSVVSIELRQMAGAEA